MNQDFDDILRKKWEEKNFPIDDQHRKDMITLLEKQPKRRIGFFWWFGGLLSAIAISGVLFYLARPGKESTAPVMTSVQSAVAEKSMLAEHEQIQSKADAPQLDVKSASQKVVNQIHEGAHTSKPSSNAAFQENSSSVKANNISHKKSTRTKSKISISNPVKSVNTSTIGHKANSPKANVFATAPNLNSSSDIVIPNHSPVAISNPVAVVVSDDAVVVVPWEPLKARNPYTSPALTSIFFSEINDEESRNVTVARPRHSHFHSIHVFAEAGGAFVPGLRNEYVSGWIVNMGLGAGYKLGSRLSLLASGGYEMQDKGFDFQKTSAVIQKDFGIRSDFNTLQPEKLHFIYAKAGLQYQLKRNLFTLFGGMQWLYGAQGTLTVSSTDQFGHHTVTSDHVWLSTNGMRHLILSTGVTYGYRITSRISLNAGLQYYFSSIDKADSALSSEGYYWSGHYSSFTPSFNINYHLYGKR